jgi:hypothetical protein
MQDLALWSWYAKDGHCHNAEAKRSASNGATSAAPPRHDQPNGDAAQRRPRPCGSSGSSMRHQRDFCAAHRGLDAGQHMHAFDTVALDETGALEATVAVPRAGLERQLDTVGAQCQNVTTEFTGAPISLPRTFSTRRTVTSASGPVCRPSARTGRRSA